MEALLRRLQSQGLLKHLTVVETRQGFQASFMHRGSYRIAIYPDVVDAILVAVGEVSPLEMQRRHSTVDDSDLF